MKTQKLLKNYNEKIKMKDTEKIYYKIFKSHIAEEELDNLKNKIFSYEWQEIQ